MTNKNSRTLNISAIMLALIVLATGIVALTSLDQQTEASNTERITGDAVNPYMNLESNETDEENQTNSSETQENQSTSNITARYGHNNSDSQVKLQTKKQRFFDASSTSGDITSYKWEFGDGTTGSGPKVNHSYIPGNYTVTLTVTDSSGEKDSFSKQITVEK